MTRFVGLDVSQKITAICIVDNAGRRLWRGQCPIVPEQISVLVRRHGGDDTRIGIETGAMTPWLVHELRNLGLEVVCLSSAPFRRASMDPKIVLRGGVRRVTRATPFGGASGEVASEATTCPSWQPRAQPFAADMNRAGA
jgi:transposase